MFGFNFLWISLMLLKGFHACDKRGTEKSVLQNGPFLSEHNEEKKQWQWLTQGYYFWTDDAFFAYIWGKKHYRNKYYILECDIDVPDDLYLDLHGNVTDQVYFYELLKIYKGFLKKVAPGEEPTICTAINHFRHKTEGDMSKLFPYLVVKAADDHGGECVNFTPRRREAMNKIKRQQICVFEDGKDCISEPKLFYTSEITEEKMR